MKSNDTIDSKIRLYLQNASAGYTNLNTYYFTSVTSWTKTEVVKRYDVETPFTLAFAFRFESASLLTYFDASVVRLPEVAYQNFNGDDLIAYNPEFFNSTYFVGMINTTDPNITINGQTISHSGELTNGTESSNTSLTGILTGAVRVDANIGGNEQAILRITGTRITSIDNSTLQGRTDNVYYGRYYATPAINATDLVVLANKEANVTTLSYANSRLDFSVNSPFNTTSSTKVYWPYIFAPRKVECTASTYSWTHNLTTNITTLNATHSSGVEWTLYVQLPDGEFCSSNDECINGYCVHRICRSSSTYCGDGYCDAGESCFSCSLDCGVCIGDGGFPPEEEPEEEELPAEEEVLECLVCPSPTEWSDCIDNKQTKTNYQCGAETNYQCESYTETRDCISKEEVSPPNILLDYWYIWVVIVTVIVIIILSRSFKIKKKFKLPSF